MFNGFRNSLIAYVAIVGTVSAAEPQPTAISPTNVTNNAPAVVPAPVPVEESLFTSAVFSGSPVNNRFWVRAEYLWWWIKDADVPPLVTTGTQASGGTLGSPGTTTLVGGRQDFNSRQGVRITAGGWIDSSETLGVEFGYFCLNGGPNQYRVSSSGAPGSATIGRPFFNVVSGQQGVQTIALAGIAGGGVGTSSDTSLHGADLNFFCNICRTPVCPPSNCDSATDPCQPNCGPIDYYRLDFFAGPRWLSLNEETVIAERVVTPGATFGIVDSFQTSNTFYGGQIGVRGEWQRGRWFVNGTGKLAIGDTHQEVRIRGTTVFSVPGAGPNVQQGGLLALPTNIGDYSRDRFTVIPELGINAGCQLTPWLRVFAGYSFLYWNRVVRPGDQIDFGINPTQLPSSTGPGTLVGPRRPAFAFHETDFWAHGVNAGVELRW